MRLRDYQQQTLSDTFSAYDTGLQSGIINLATGMGKTFTAVELGRQFKKNYINKKIMFLVDQRELAFQAKKAFQQVNPDMRVGIEMATIHAKKTDDIIISSVQTISKKGSIRIGKFKPDDFGLIIADECHKSISESWLRVMSYMGTHPENQHPDRFLVGLTATAYRNTGTPLGYLYQDIFARYDVNYGIKNAWLTDIEWIPLQTNTDISKVRTRAGEFLKSELANVIDNELRNAEIVKAYKEYFAGETCIIFAGSVDHAYKLTQIFKDENINAVCIEGNTEENIRKKWVNQFREKLIDVIINYNTMSVGVDFPEAHGIILARPIKSPLLYTQMVGRALRTSQTALIDYASTVDERKTLISLSAKPRAKIVDLCDTVGKHDVCTLPILFGLNPKLTAKKERFFEEVVEVIEAIAHENQIDKYDIVDPDKITFKIKKLNTKIQSYSVDNYIKKCSNNTWLPIGDNGYELLISEENKSIYTNKNMLDKYDVFEFDTKHKEGKLLNTVNSLAGAIKLGDDYAELKNYNMTFAKQEKWHQDPPTEKQLNAIKNIFKHKNRAVISIKEKYINNLPKLLLFGKLIETKEQASNILKNMWNK